jgi:hypothetical protein
VTAQEQQNELQKTFALDIDFALEFGYIELHNRTIIGSSIYSDSAIYSNTDIYSDTITQ